MAYKFGILIEPLESGRFTAQNPRGSRKNFLTNGIERGKIYFHPPERAEGKNAPCELNNVSEKSTRKEGGLG